MSKEFFVLASGIKDDGTCYVRQRFFTAPQYDINDPIVIDSIASIIHPLSRKKDVVTVEVSVFERIDNYGI